MDFTSIILGLLLTAVAYMAFPLVRLLVNGSRFSAKRAHRISLWNSIVLGLVFCILTIEFSEDGTMWNAAPAVLYYWINKAILTDKNAKETLPRNKDNRSKEQTNNASPSKADTTVSRPPQISDLNETPKNYGNFSVPLNDLALQQSHEPLRVSYCRKCGAQLIDGSQFCRKCGTKAIVGNTHSEEKTSAKPKITPFNELVLQTIGLPAMVADKSDEELNIVKNRFAYCDAIIFVEFFIRANVLGIAPTKEIAMKFSDKYIEAVIKETIKTIPNTEEFFADMFYSRATLFDSILMNSDEPVMDIVEVLTHIIHKEIDDNSYVTMNDKSFKYFGGLLENLAIKSELVTLFQCIHDCTTDTMKKIEEYLKTL